MKESLADQASPERTYDSDAKDIGAKDTGPTEVDAARPYASGTGPGALPELSREERQQVAAEMTGQRSRSLSRL